MAMILLAPLYIAGTTVYSFFSLCIVMSAARDSVILAAVLSLFTLVPLVVGGAVLLFSGEAHYVILGASVLTGFALGAMMVGRGAFAPKHIKPQGASRNTLTPTSGQDHRTKPDPASSEVLPDGQLRFGTCKPFRGGKFQGALRSALSKGYLTEADFSRLTQLRRNLGVTDAEWRQCEAERRQREIEHFGEKKYRFVEALRDALQKGHLTEYDLKCLREDQTESRITSRDRFDIELTILGETSVSRREKDTAVEIMKRQNIVMP